MLGLFVTFSIVIIIACAYANVYFIISLYVIINRVVYTSNLLQCRHFEWLHVAG